MKFDTIVVVVESFKNLFYLVIIAFNNFIINFPDYILYLTLYNGHACHENAFMSESETTSE